MCEGLYHENFCDELTLGRETKVNTYSPEHFVMSKFASSLDFWLKQAIISDTLTIKSYDKS